MTVQLHPSTRSPGAGPAGRSAALSAVGPALVPVLAGLSLVVAAWPWERGLAAPDTTVWLVVAALAPVAIAFVLGGALRQPAASSYAASALGLVVLVGAVTGLHPSAISQNLADEPARLLTETLPLAGSSALLVVPVTVVWVLAAATAETLTRARRWPIAFALPVLSYLVAFGATAGAPRHDDASGAWLLGTLAVLATALQRNDDRSLGAPGGALRPGRQRVEAASRPRRSRRALAGALVALLVAVGLALGIPRVQPLAGAQASLRRRPTTTAAVVVDPVDVIQSLRDADPDAPPTPLFTVTTGARSTGYLGVADLDDYDGDTWSFDTTFEPTGGRIPAGPQARPGAVSGDQGAVVTQRYDLGHAYPLPFVPSIDRPTDVAGLSVDADSGDGAIVPVAPLSGPQSYTVTSRAADVTIDGLAPADTFDRTPANAAELAVPPGATRATGAVDRFETTMTGLRPNGSLGFLRALVAALRSGERRLQPSSGGRAPPSHGGTSLAEVVQAVTIDRVATPEQFATFIALAARELGIPARLVTGFRTAPAAMGRPLPAGTTTLTNRDAWTWAEVAVVGLGWVVVDATPVTTAGASTAPPAAATTPTTLAPPLANAVPVSGGPGGTRAVAPPTRVGPSAAAHLRRWRSDLLVALLIAVLLVGAGPALAAARCRWRRAARHCEEPALLAIGAWLELLDGLEVAGLAVDGDATTAELLAAATARFGEEAVEGAALVADAAQQAVCSPSRPPAATDARAAWVAAGQTARRLRRSLPLGPRVRALFRVGRQVRRPASPPRPVQHRRLQPVGRAGAR